MNNGSDLRALAASAVDERGGKVGNIVLAV